MADPRSDGCVGAMSESELPPGIDVPSPPDQSPVVGAAVPADVERDIRSLADRVGGLERLRELVTELVTELAR